VQSHTAESYANGAAFEAGAAAEVKYADIDNRYVFEPTALRLAQLLQPH